MLVKSLMAARLDKGRISPGSTKVGLSEPGWVKVRKSLMSASVCVMLVSRSWIALWVDVTILRSLERLEV